MKKPIIYLFSLFCLFLVVSCDETETTEDTELEATGEKVPSKEEMVARGEYLVTVIGCSDCHTPKKMTDHGPEPDMSRLLMGHPADSKLPPIDNKAFHPGNWMNMNSDLTAAVGPWGVSFAANLTPDETGLGNWSYDQFKRAMTEGKYKGMEGGRMLLPPMPWPNFAHLTDADLQAIYEYLKTIPAIKNGVPAPIPPTGA